MSTKYHSKQSSDIVLNGFYFVNIYYYSERRGEGEKDKRTEEGNVPHVRQQIELENTFGKNRRRKI